MSFDYNAKFLELGFKYQDWKSLGILRHPYTQGTVKILNEVYNIMKTQKFITPIENLPDEEKNKIWEQAKPFVKELSKNEKIEYAKAIYILKEEKEKVSESPKNVIEGSDDL